MDYKEAGVDIGAGEALVSWLKQQQSNPESPKPHQDKLVSGIGGFSALFRADFKDMDDPCLVSATDGIGTKLLLAIAAEDYSTIGQDLVAMCVNDLICCGASPLFFLDYFATGKLDLEVAKSFLSSVQQACHQSQCALIGGETAEMPGVYHNNDFDCAGFAVGVVDRPKAYGPERVKQGDKIIAVESSGFHSNGYSLVRKLFAEDLKEWQQKLLKPTHLYVQLVEQAKKQFANKIHAMAHITGGGMDNIPRVLPKEFAAQLNAWDFPELFLEAQKRAQIDDQEMLKTFNCGWGFVFIVSPEIEEELCAILDEFGFEGRSLGEVVPAEVDNPSRWSIHGG